MKIVPEERLNEVFSQLPTILGDSPFYDWGNEKHLDRVVKANPNTYPLIYQISKDEEHNLAEDTVLVNWEAVIATRNPNVNLFNSERWELSFKNALNPLAGYIIEGLELAGFIIIDNKVRMGRYGNYGENENFTIDIWDAIYFRATLLIHNNCIGTITFN